MAQTPGIGLEAPEPAKGIAERPDVGNLPNTINQESLQAMFERHGREISSPVLDDRETGRGRGFGFIQMANDAEVGQNHVGRRLTIIESKPRPSDGHQTAGDGCRRNG